MSVSAKPIQVSRLQCRSRPPVKAAGAALFSGLAAISAALLSGCSETIERFGPGPGNEAPLYVTAEPAGAGILSYGRQGFTHYDRQGLATVVGPGDRWTRTFNGENFDRWALLASHPSLPLPSLIEVTNLESGCRIMLRVNERGPVRPDAILGLTPYAADLLGFEGSAEAPVRVRYVRPAPVVGSDGAEQAFLVRMRERGCRQSGGGGSAFVPIDGRPAPRPVIGMLPAWQPPPVVVEPRPWRPAPAPRPIVPVVVVHRPPPRPVVPIVVVRPPPPRPRAPHVWVATLPPPHRHPPPVRTIDVDIHLKTEPVRHRPVPPRPKRPPCLCPVPRN